MKGQHIYFVIVSFLTAHMSRDTSSQQCGVETYSVYQMMLQGHTFKTFKARPGSFDCGQACLADVRCQSYNVVMLKGICELNNRTKEARPEDFVKNKDRYYMEKGGKRVHLGSISQLPADSCKEIKSSAGGQAVSGKYWLDPTRSGNSILASCDMRTEIADFCIKHKCQNNATCVNNQVNYTRACNSSGWTGSYCEKDLLGWYSYRPAHSCKHILEFGNSKGNGEYWIDPEKNGNPLKVYCDMTTNGGGWLLVCNFVYDGSNQMAIMPTSYREIASRSKICLAKSAMADLKAHMSFIQLRFHCNKRHLGRTFHVITAANSAGEAVVQYFSGQTDVQPEACGSFVKMDDDNSKLAGVCQKWGREDGNIRVGKWGHGKDQDRLSNHPAFEHVAYHWVLYDSPDLRMNCDDYNNQVSNGDFWKVFVR